MELSKIEYPPAFGFETRDSNAYNYYNHYQKAKKDVIVKALVFDLSPFYFPAHKQKDVKRLGGELIRAGQTVGEIRFPRSIHEPLLHDFLEDHLYFLTNLFKVLAYIPIVGSFIGYSRLCAIHNLSDELLPNKSNYQFRGLIELFSCGLILLIPDLLMWAYRAYHVQPTEFKYKD